MGRALTWEAAARNALFFVGRLQEQIRADGHVDLAAIITDKVRLGALAELEMQGAVQFTGPPDSEWKQPCRVVPTGERRAARIRRSISETAEWSRLSGRKLP